MDFFKSVFSHGGQEEEEVAERTQGNPRVAGAWGGGFSWLMKTLASRSESAIQTCRRDLGEFGTGLRNETEALREAIRDLHSSLGAGAAVAGESAVRPAERFGGGSAGRGAAEILAEGEQAGDARANLVRRRVIASRVVVEEEEDLSWEVEEDDDKATEEEQKQRKQERGEEEEATIGGKPPVENSRELGNTDKIVSPSSSSSSSSTTTTSEDRVFISSETKWEKNGGEVNREEVAAAAKGTVAEEEYDVVGWWDEVEDVVGEGNDEMRKAGVSGGSAQKVDLRKRLLSAAEADDEDLAWDFEDGEPIDP